MKKAELEAMVGELTIRNNDLVISNKALQDKLAGRNKLITEQKDALHRMGDTLDELEAKVKTMLVCLQNTEETKDSEGRVIDRREVSLCREARMAEDLMDFVQFKKRWSPEGKMDRDDLFLRGLL